MVVLASLAVFSGCNALLAPLFYFAESSHGRVIDSHTLEPVPGAVVVAEWIPEFLISLDGGRAAPMKVLETVTDIDGKYEFPNWGPRPRSPLWSLTYMDPEITVFKAGYRPRFEINRSHRNTYIRTSDWSGADLEIEVFVGTSKEGLDQLEQILSHAAWDRTIPTGLAREMLKEGPAYGQRDKPFFDDVEQLMSGP